MAILKPVFDPTQTQSLIPNQEKLINKLDECIDAINVSVAPTASGVSYDNSASGLTATDVQDAIDEVYAAIPPIPTIPTELKDLTDVNPALAPSLGQYFVFNGTTWNAANLPSANLDNVLFVSQNGNDLTGDGSISKPFQTITKALTVAAPGYTIKITYNSLSYVEDLTVNNSITLEGWNGSVISSENIFYQNQLISVSGKLIANADVVVKNLLFFPPSGNALEINDCICLIDNSQFSGDIQLIYTSNPAKLYCTRCFLSNINSNNAQNKLNLINCTLSNITGIYAFAEGIFLVNSSAIDINLTSGSVKTTNCIITNIYTDYSTIYNTTINNNLTITGALLLSNSEINGIIDLTGATNFIHIGSIFNRSTIVWGTATETRLNLSKNDSYDPATSGLTSIDVQDAIDELSTMVVKNPLHDYYYISYDQGSLTDADGSIVKPFKTITQFCEFIGQPINSDDFHRHIICEVMDCEPQIASGQWCGIYTENPVLPHRTITFIGRGIKINGNVTHEISDGREWGTASSDYRGCITFCGLPQINARDSHQRLRNGFHISGTFRTMVLTRNIASIQGDGAGNITVETTTPYQATPGIPISISGTVNYNEGWDVTSFIDDTHFTASIRAGHSNTSTVLENIGSFYECDTTYGSGATTHDMQFMGTYIQGAYTCDDGTVNGGAISAGGEVLYLENCRVFTGIEGRGITAQRWINNLFDGQIIVSTFSAIERNSFLNHITTNTITTSDLNWLNNSFTSLPRNFTINNASQTIKMDSVSYTSFLAGNWIWVTNIPTISLLDQDRSIANTTTIPGATVQAALQWLASNTGNTLKLYFDDTASDIGGYFVASPTPISTAEIIDSVIVNSSTLIIETYATPVGGIGVTSIPAGTWEFNIFDFVSLATNVTNLIFEIYKRDIASTETLLFTATSPEINNLTTPTLMQFLSTQSSFACATTDRIVVKVYGTTTHSSNVTVGYSHNGTARYSFIKTPIPA